MLLAYQAREGHSPGIHESGMTTFPSLVRAATSTAIAAWDKTSALKVAVREFSSDRVAEWLVRAPALITDTASAPPLARSVMPDLITALGPTSAAARIFNEGLRLSFGRSAALAVPTILGDSAYSSFVAEGSPIPVVQGQVEPLIILTPKKLATIVVLTSEMVRSSNIEALMTDALIRSTGVALDFALLGDAPPSDAQPAGLRYGIAPLVASTAPDPNAALMQDLETVTRASMEFSEKTPVMVLSRIRALMAELRSQHGLAPLTVIGTRALRGTMIMMGVAPQHCVSALGEMPEITATRESAMLMDTAPDGGPPTRSMWQTDCVAVLVKLPVSWGLREASGVAWLVTTNW
jgi:hypothetical protein